MNPRDRLVQILNDPALGLGPCKPDGVHSQILRAAQRLRQLRHALLDATDDHIQDAIASWVGENGSDRRTPEQLCEEIARVWGSEYRPGIRLPRPGMDPALVQEALATVPVTPLEDLPAISPLTLPASDADKAQFAIDTLYPPLSLVVTGRTRYGAVVHRLPGSPMLGWLGEQFIVPNPAAKHSATCRRTGRQSCRVKECFTTLPWFLVFEVDPPRDQPDSPLRPKTAQFQLARALAAKHDLQLCAVVDSGNKSLHHWFSVRHLQLEQLQKVCDTASRLGADPAVWPVNAWVRMPGGLRVNEDTGATTRQTLLYLARPTAPNLETKL